MLYLAEDRAHGSGQIQIRIIDQDQWRRIISAARRVIARAGGLWRMIMRLVFNPSVTAARAVGRVIR